MRLTTTAPDESLEALAARVYELGERPAQAAVRRAAKALADANPFLRRIDEVPAGTVVAVPPIERAEVRAGATERVDATAALLVADRVRAAAALAQRQLLADLDAESGAARATMELARSEELQEVRGDTPALDDVLARTFDAARARGLGTEELRDRQQDVFTQIADDLAELMSTFGSRGAAAS